MNKQIKNIRSIGIINLVSTILGIIFLIIFLFLTVNYQQTVGEIVDWTQLPFGSVGLLVVGLTCSIVSIILSFISGFQLLFYDTTNEELKSYKIAFGVLCLLGIFPQIFAIGFASKAEKLEYQTTTVLAEDVQKRIGQNV